MDKSVVTCIPAYFFFTVFSVQSKLSVGMFCKKFNPVSSKLACRIMVSKGESENV